MSIQGKFMVVLSATPLVLLMACGGGMKTVKVGAADVPEDVLPMLTKSVVHSCPNISGDYECVATPAKKETASRKLTLKLEKNEAGVESLTVNEGNNFVSDGEVHAVEKKDESKMIYNVACEDKTLAIRSTSVDQVESLRKFTYLDDKNIGMDLLVNGPTSSRHEMHVCTKK